MSDGQTTRGRYVQPQARRPSQHTDPSTSQGSVKLQLLFHTYVELIPGIRGVQATSFGSASVSRAPLSGPAQFQALRTIGDVGYQQGARRLYPVLRTPALQTKQGGQTTSNARRLFPVLRTPALNTSTTTTRTSL